ncbi:MAG: Holliday junction branch migration protein RuvA [Oscillospiraceae bacterium]|nr:Holliday junction branch migration protein RuvA [Oscillospiraceae bacterium]
MFAYIKGKLVSKSNNYVVVEAGNIGYKVFMSATAIDRLGEIETQVKVHTYYYVREDNISLYGFVSQEELRMFELLLSVSGVGAKSAIGMLSAITPSDFALAIISNDIAELTKIQGIGAKTAARIVLELKDKLKTEDAIIQKSEVGGHRSENKKNETVVFEAIQALQILGYTKREIQLALEKTEVKNLSTQDIIKKALVILAE